MNISENCIIYREYYMAAWKYEMYVCMYVKLYFNTLTSITLFQYANLYFEC